MATYNNLKPTDYYVVYNDFYNENYNKELNLLYLPLIGSNAIKLYQFLSTKILREKNMTNNLLHFDIIDNLGMDIKKISLMRKQLEAIGLLKTYFWQSNEKIVYVYKILRPLSFNSFFENHLLSALLKNTIGEGSYNLLVDKFSHNQVHFSEFKDITAKFSEVFSTNNLDDYQFDNILGKDTGKGPNLDSYYFDFNKLNYLLSNKYLADILNNSGIKETILELAHLYKVTPNEMAEGIEQSVDSVSGGLDININDLKDYLAQLFIIVKKQEVPTLKNMLNKHLINDTYNKERELTNEEKLAKIMDNLNYIEFLNKKHSLILSNVDGNNINKLITKYNFSSGVLNVLLDYAIIESKSSGIPNFNYLDKIASTWSSQRLITALDAMNFVNSERDKFKQTRTQKEENKIRGTKLVNKTKTISYDLDIEEFSRNKLNIILPTKTVEELSTIKEKYNFSNELINYLLEYTVSIDVNKKIPTANFLESVASSWHLNKVKTISDVKGTINKRSSNNYKSKKHRVVETPDYIKNQLNNLSNFNEQNYESNNVNISYEEYQRLLKEKGME
ncbi:DnaD domain protein [Gemella sp. GH3]|uniref:DnaD domain protein n=1 Tax=unclassified Gemella TaxID=2624949 RepID=UPI0015CFC9E1|nr:MULTISPECIES: DnaD domain protein [unclassified Gemella]MBF0714163.1 DnaD domain protein [Gemella sp. GH3.1]NYS51115.1 DnaD domain protein [Gemella sp. GH3]